MAAHDDKISDKRRKLFKALSAAPVVMTLRPGSALAGTSSYQCLADPPTFTTPVHLQSGGQLPAQCDVGDANCLAYVERDYWDRAGLSEECGTLWDEVVGANNIVIYDSSVPTLRKLTVPGFVATDIDADGWGVEGSTLSFPTGCSVEAKTGYFLLKIDPVKDGEDFVDFDPLGPFPEAGGDPLAKSCWNSFGKTSEDVFFVQG